MAVKRAMWTVTETRQIADRARRLAGRVLRAAANRLDPVPVTVEPDRGGGYRISFHDVSLAIITAGDIRTDRPLSWAQNTRDGAPATLPPDRAT